ncbi:hypothetical protein Gotur_027067 [Gossypium turneri]
MIGGYVMPDLSRNITHLRWLLKLIDFRATDEFSWGSVALTILYQEICGTTPPTKAKIRGCVSLLQSWAQFHFPFLRPRVDHLYTFLLITSYAGISTALEDIRFLLDRRSEAQDSKIRAVILMNSFKI